MTRALTAKVRIERAIEQTLQVEVELSLDSIRGKVVVRRDDWTNNEGNVAEVVVSEMCLDFDRCQTAAALLEYARDLAENLTIMPKGQFNYLEQEGRMGLNAMLAELATPRGWWFEIEVRA